MPSDKNFLTKGLGLRSRSVTKKQSISSKSWFFGIGINDYIELPNLNNALRDVLAIRDLLVKKYDIEADNTFLLSNEKATREGIIDQFDILNNTIKKEDKLIIYYSGHGWANEAQNLGFWMPHDAEKVGTARYIRNSTIRDYIRTLKAHHILLISDACFSGSLFARRNADTDWGISELEGLSSRWAISSGRSNEEVYDGKPGAHSPFAQSILDTLQANNLPRMNVAKLADKIIELTSSQYRQLPEGNPLFDVGHKGGQYIFCKKGIHASAPVLKPKKELTDQKVTIDSKSVLVKGGAYEMGNPKIDAPEQDRPVHEVVVSDFYMDTYPVSVRQFRLFVEATNYKTDAEKTGEVLIWGVPKKGINWRHNTNCELRSSDEDQHPVIFISWNDAVEYAKFVNKRLPTEAEWEYAAKEGITQSKLLFSGSEEINKIAWHLDNSEEKTHPVGLKISNRLGIYDMTGLVWEWCSDFFSPLYYRQSQRINPKGPASGTHRVMRGGSWSNPAHKMEVTDRFSGPANMLSNCVGFRCVEDIK